jgi:hypothetical protein
MLPCLPKRLVIAKHRVDFRKQWDGLLAECYKMGFDPYAGDCVVFIKRDRRQLRALYGDARGLLWVARRFDGGSLALPWVFTEQRTSASVAATEVALLLEGASYTVTGRVSPWKKDCLESR